MKTENFYETDPTRLTGKELKDPFLVVEEFFCIQGLPSWRRDVKTWFKNALSAEYECEKPGEFHFFQEKLTNLIEAGFIISKQRLTYQPNITHCDKYTAGEWLLQVRNKHITEGRECQKESEPHLLNEMAINDPQAFIYSFCAFDNIVRLRKTLYDWAQAVLGSEPLWEVGFDDDLWGGYERIEKLIEGFYLLLVKDAQYREDEENIQSGGVMADEPTASACYHDTDPNALRKDERENPFLFVEEFSWMMSFSEWKQVLTNSFRSALAGTQIPSEKPGDTLFHFQKLNNLIEAGFHISQRRLRYRPIRSVDDQYTAGEWYCKWNTDLSTLPKSKNATDPTEDIWSFFSPEQVKQLRTTLSNWLEAAFGNGPIWEITHTDDLWQGYEDLQRMIELFFLLLTRDVKRFKDATEDDKEVDDIDESDDDNDEDGDADLSPVAETDTQLQGHTELSSETVTPRS